MLVMFCRIPDLCKGHHKGQGQPGIRKGSTSHIVFNASYEFNPLAQQYETQYGSLLLTRVHASSRDMKCIQDRHIFFPNLRAISPTILVIVQPSSIPPYLFHLNNK